MPEYSVWYPATSLLFLPLEGRKGGARHSGQGADPEDSGSPRAGARCSSLRMPAVFCWVDDVDGAERVAHHPTTASTGARAGIS